MKHTDLLSNELRKKYINSDKLFFMFYGDIEYAFIHAIQVEITKIKEDKIEMFLQILLFELKKHERLQVQSSELKLELSKAPESIKNPEITREKIKSVQLLLDEYKYYKSIDAERSRSSFQKGSRNTIEDVLGDNTNEFTDKLKKAGWIDENCILVDNKRITTGYKLAALIKGLFYYKPYNVAPELRNDEVKNIILNSFGKHFSDSTVEKPNLHDGQKLFNEVGLS